MAHALKDFLNLKEQFHLGHLTSEQANSLTKNLSFLAQSNLLEAIKRLELVDKKLLGTLKNYSLKAIELKQDIGRTLKSGHRVFFCGCGATGRQSLTLETLFKKKYPQYASQVISFMAGGDFALIKSVESFEDSPQYGARQLRELGFKEGDLLVGSTEGGETPFVLGAIDQALEMSSKSPYLLFCNAIQELYSVTRSKRLLQNKRVKVISLVTGPMALSGSTRMQATTSLLFLSGMSLLYFDLKEQDFEKLWQDYLTGLSALNYLTLAKLIEKEYETYKQGGHITYLADSHLAITVLTDTTERAPTFSLAPFEYSSSEPVSLSYLAIRKSRQASKAWEEMLGRTPRGLNWKDIPYKLDLDEIFKFDISEKSIKRREKVGSSQCLIQKEKSVLKIYFDSTLFCFPLFLDDELYTHLVTKLILNTHSTLVMGKLGRYSSNVMTWVKPSNYKLIDRSIRYVQLLAKEQNKKASYDDIAKLIFKIKEEDFTGAIVLEALKRLS